MQGIEENMKDTEKHILSVIYDKLSNIEALPMKIYMIYEIFEKFVRFGCSSVFETLSSEIPFVFVE